jgi:hypothetical protein
VSSLDLYEMNTQFIILINLINLSSWHLIFMITRIVRGV